MPENPKDPKTVEKQRKYLRYLKEAWSLVRAADFAKAKRKVAKLEEVMDEESDILDFNLDDEEEEG